MKFTFNERELVNFVLHVNLLISENKTREDAYNSLPVIVDSTCQALKEWIFSCNDDVKR